MLIVLLVPHRPKLEDMLEDYWRLMPEYQQVNLEDLIPQRILFGLFPTYRNSPLPPVSDRILQIGDASGIQSPLSFGGFGALMRYLPRLKAALLEALEVRCLTACGYNMDLRICPNHLLPIVSIAPIPCFCCSPYNFSAGRLRRFPVC